MLTLTAAGKIEGILAFEASLARALAGAGVISSSAAATIAGQCDLALLDVENIERDAAVAGNIAIPIVERLRQLVGRIDPDAATYVHWGATSQDALDSGLALQLRDALGSMEMTVARIIVRLADLATEHANTPMVGRTLLQQAVPTTFGFKVSTWLDAILRHQTRLADVRTAACTLQFGGAVGTLAALGSDGARVSALLAEDLKLRRPRISWHTTRDRLADVGTTLATIAGSLGKIARDVSLMAQSEIAEVREGAALGRGRSSTMPHKQNPVSCAAILAAAVRAPHLAATILSAMVQEHERALGGWQAEWSALPELCQLVDASLSQAADMLDGLEVHPDRMAAALDESRGLVFSEAVSFALSSHIGAAGSRPILDRLLRQHAAGAHLRDAIMADAEAARVLTNRDIDYLFDVRNQLGVAEQTARDLATLAREQVERSR